MAVWDIKERYDLVRSNEATRGDIGVVSSSNSQAVDKIQISTTGNSTTYGNLASDTGNGGGMAGSTTRILHGGGNQGPQVNEISYKEIVSNGNFSDFGDLTAARQMLAGVASHTKAIFAGGRTPSASNVIDFNIFASLGNSIDFGDLSVARFGLSGVQSTTRAVFPGGGAPTNVIDFVTMASAGNATDFGDIGTSTNFNYFGGGSSETRGVFGGGGNPSNASIINYIEIASVGNSQDFGDLTVNRLTMAAVSNSNRVCFSSGQQNTPGGPGTNVVDFVTITTTGDATDFGDATGNHGFKTAGHSNGHGGLPLGEFQRPSVTYMPGSGRGFIGGGSDPGTGNGVRGVWGGNTDKAVNMSSLEFQSLGNGADYGDLTVGRQRCFSHSSTTRGVFAGGQAGSAPNYDEYDTIDYITIASAGNAADFGDLTVQRWFVAPGGSPTRGVFGSGVSNPAGYSNVIDYITVASTGDATDFGDMLAATGYTAGCSSSVRQVFGGGYTPSAINVMQYVTIASTGNSTDFGDLLDTTGYATGTSNNTRGIFAGDLHPSSTNVIQYITIASTGNSADFGDLNNAGHSHGTTSDSHGGLQV